MQAFCTFFGLPFFLYILLPPSIEFQMKHAKSFQLEMSVIPPTSLVMQVHVLCVDSYITFGGRKELSIIYSLDFLFQIHASMSLVFVVPHLSVEISWSLHEEGSCDEIPDEGTDASCSCFPPTQESRQGTQQSRPKRQDLFLTQE